MNLQYKCVIAILNFFEKFSFAERRKEISNIGDLERKIIKMISEEKILNNL